VLRWVENDPGLLLVPSWQFPFAWQIVKGKHGPSSNEEESASLLRNFDAATALYVFYSQNHDGQASEFYRRLSRISEVFNPGALFSESRFFDPKVDDFHEAREFYSRLCRKHGVLDPFDAEGR